MERRMTSRAKELRQSERRGPRCCSRLTWQCARRERALNNESTGFQWAQRPRDGWRIGIGIRDSRAPCRIGRESRDLGPQRRGCAGCGQKARRIEHRRRRERSDVHRRCRAKNARDRARDRHTHHGISGPNAKLWEYPIEDWRKIFAVNVEGTFYCCRAIVPLMRERNYGRIVNIASVAGKGGNPNASAYSASKAAVIALTKSLGKELADTSVRVNCVTPAAVRTPLFSQMTQAHIDYMLSKIPLGRLGEPQEIAALVAWLASEECSFSTAAVFDLSGGRSTY